VSIPEVDTGQLRVSPDASIVYYSSTEFNLNVEDVTYLLFVDAKTGKLLWKTKAGTNIDGWPQFSADGKMCLILGDEQLETHDARTGKVLSKLLPLPENVSLMPIGKENSFYWMKDWTELYRSRLR
jgi:outer membrane protein assembly factor BamB